MASNSGVSPPVPILDLAAHLGLGLHRGAGDALAGGFRAFPRRSVAALDDLHTVALLEKSLR